MCMLQVKGAIESAKTLKLGLDEPAINWVLMMLAASYKVDYYCYQWFLPTNGSKKVLGTDRKGGVQTTHFQEILTLSMINRTISSPIQLHQPHTRSRFTSHFFSFLIKINFRIFITISVSCNPPNIGFRCFYETCEMEFRIEFWSGLVELWRCGFSVDFSEERSGREDFGTFQGCFIFL